MVHVFNEILSSSRMSPRKDAKELDLKKQVKEARILSPDLGIYVSTIPITQSLNRPSDRGNPSDHPARLKQLKPNLIPKNVEIMKIP